MWKLVDEAISRGVTRVADALEYLVPALVAVLVILLLTAIFAWIVHAVVLRMLRRAALDERVAEGAFCGIREWSPGGSPARLLARLAASLVVFAGLVFALGTLEMPLTSGFAHSLLQYVPKVLAAGVVLLVAYPISLFLARSVLIGAVNAHLPSARLLSLGAKWLVLIIGAAMALQQLEIGGQIVPLAFAILFGGIVLSMSLAIGLASRDLLRRVIEREKEREEAEREPFHHL
jgi:hypothetical protein